MAGIYCPQSYLTSLRLSSFSSASRKNYSIDFTVCHEDYIRQKACKMQLLPGPEQAIISTCIACECKYCKEKMSSHPVCFGFRDWVFCLQTIRKGKHVPFSSKLFSCIFFGREKGPISFPCFYVLGYPLNGCSSFLFYFPFNKF